MRSGKRKALFITAVSLAALLLASCAAAYALTVHQMKKSFGRGTYPDPRYSAMWRYEHYEPAYPRREVSFLSGKNTLRGWIYCPENTKGLIVFAHGLGDGHEDYLGLLTKLLDCGWRVFAYDATGSCESEGKGTVGLAQSALDLHNALLFVESDPELDALPVMVMGHSWGGYAAAAVLGFGHDVKGSVSLAGYAEPFAELSEQCDRMFGAAGKLLHPFIWAYNKSLFGKYAGLSAVDGINASGIPVLVAHGTGDETISFDGASIMARREEITNPRVSCHVFSEPGRNGHSSFLSTAEYIAYKNSVLIPKREEIMSRYGNDIPDDVREEFWSSVDKALYNDVSPELVLLVDSFLSDCLEP